MAEEQPNQSQDSGLDDDVDLWEPVTYEPKPCPHCGTYITEGCEAYWVVENPSDGFYMPYCNEFHYQAHKKIGLWAVGNGLNPAPLEI